MLYTVPAVFVSNRDLIARATVATTSATHVLGERTLLHEIFGTGSPLLMCRHRRASPKFEMAFLAMKALSRILLARVEKRAVAHV